MKNDEKWIKDVIDEAGRRGIRVRLAVDVVATIPSATLTCADPLNRGVTVTLSAMAPESHPQGACGDGGKCDQCKPTPCGDSFCFASCTMCAWPVPPAPPNLSGRCVCGHDGCFHAVVAPFRCLKSPGCPCPSFRPAPKPPTGALVKGLDRA